MLSRAESIRRLSQDLRETKDRLEPDALIITKDRFEPWAMVWMLMIGACYSLGRSIPYLNASRRPQRQLDHATGFLDEIIAKGTSDADEQPYGSWVIGYYLYAGEQRIQSALDRLIRSYCNRPRQSALQLINNPMLIRCTHCRMQPNRAYPKSQRIFSQFMKEVRVFFRASGKIQPSLHLYADTSQGACLARVWNRVNEIKHAPGEKTNIEDPKKRWNDALKGLRALLTMYCELLEHVGLLS